MEFSSKIDSMNPRVSSYQRKYSDHHDFRPPVERSSVSTLYDVKTEEDTMGIELPALDNFPTSINTTRYDSIRIDDAFETADSDEFVDAVTFMATQRMSDDSFLHDVQQEAAIEDGEWNENPRQRPSDIFIQRSRNMDHVEFTSPTHSQHIEKSTHDIWSMKTPASKKARSYELSIGPSEAATTISSEYDIHVDGRHILTPNSFKYLEERFRKQTIIGNDIDGTDVIETEPSAHSSRVLQMMEERHVNDTIVAENEAVDESNTALAMSAGPNVIKRALVEIQDATESVDTGSESDSPIVNKVSLSLKDLQPGVRTTREVKSQPQTERQRFHEASRHAGSRIMTDNSSLQLNHEQQKHNGRASSYSNTQQKMRLSLLATPSPIQDSDEVERQQERTNRQSMVQQDKNTSAKDIPLKTQQQRQKPVSSRLVESSSGEDFVDHHLVTSKNGLKTKFNPKDVLTYHKAGNSSNSRTEVEKVGFHQSFARASSKPRPSVVPKTDATVNDSCGQHYAHASIESNGVSVTVKNSRADVSNSITSQNELLQTTSSIPVAAMLPYQLPRRCRRLLCSVGEKLTEEIFFTNGSNMIGRICVSLLPLTKGCQQFMIEPAVLELVPGSSCAFTVTFTAQFSGLVSGIFQFRAVGVNELFPPYELLIEASVRHDLKLTGKEKHTLLPGIRHQVNDPLVEEVSEGQGARDVQITPTFIRFVVKRDRNHKETIRNAEISLVNRTAQEIPYQIKSLHEHLSMDASRGRILPASKKIVTVSVLCRPFGSHFKNTEDDWCGSITVVIGDILSREVSVVIDRNAMTFLPDFDDVARTRHALSTQTDSFYYTKKVNRRGLYFHARAVECGSCVVGESHQVPVYICNGSDVPMTVFLQELQDPFACEYTPTTLQSKKFIEIPITFTPKTVGKVATCLVAYTVNGKASVTLIARGVDGTKAA